MAPSGSDIRGGRRKVKVVERPAQRASGNASQGRIFFVRTRPGRHEMQVTASDHRKIARSGVRQRVLRAGAITDGDRSTHWHGFHSSSSHGDRKGRECSVREKGARPLSDIPDGFHAASWGGWADSAALWAVRTAARPRMADRSWCPAAATSGYADRCDPRSTFPRPAHRVGPERGLMRAVGTNSGVPAR